MKRLTQYLPLLSAVLIVAIAAMFGHPLNAHALALSGGLIVGQTMLTGQQMQQSFPSLSDFKSYMTVQYGSVEVIKQSLYDTVIYPTAGLAQMLFFQNPIGQGLSASPGNAGLPKALSDTDLQLPGQLPAPQAFWVDSIEVDFQPGSSAAANTFALQIPGAFAAVAIATLQAGAHDVNAFYSTGALQFTIGTKPYLQEAALLRFPPKARFEYDVAVASNSATTAEVVKEKLKAGGRPYNLTPGLPIMTSMNFNVSLLWPVIVPTPSGFNGAVRVILDGWLFRAVQ
ncbi:MAG: hypothetical protein ACREDH_12240 [Methylocella sp.]